MAEFPPGLVTFYRPARKRKRVFTAKDVARIAKYAIADGADPLDVLVGILKSTGRSGQACQIVAGISLLIAISKLLVKIGGILAVSKILDFVLSVLTNKLFQKLPWVRRATAVLIILAASYDGIISAATEAVSDVGIYESLLTSVSEICAREKLNESDD